MSILYGDSGFRGLGEAQTFLVVDLAARSSCV